MNYVGNKISINNSKLYEIIIAYEIISNFSIELKITVTFELYSIYN